jgi:hypothetical protein
LNKKGKALNLDYEEFKKKLKDINLTIKEFAKLSDTSYRTCISWSIKNRKIPNWVNAFLNLHIENQKLKNERIDDKEYQELLELRKAFQVLLSKGKVIE